MNTFALVASWAHVLVPVEHMHCSVSGFRLAGNRENWRRGATSGVQGAQTCRSCRSRHLEGAEWDLGDANMRLSKGQHQVLLPDWDIRTWHP